MLKFGKAVTRKRRLILAVALLLLIPSVLGIMATRINYDVLDYLPDDIETMQGQDILMEDFGKGGFAMVMVDGMQKKDVAQLKSKFENVDHVESVIWYDSIMDVSIPYEMIPEDIYEKFNNGDTTLMAVFFDSSTSSDESLNAVSEIRKIGGRQCFVSGMTAFVEDLKELAEAEEPVYVCLAVLLACCVLAFFMDSWVIPFVFIAGIGIAILYNLGSNYFMGEISYITKALSAVLQLGVTMDYSIFLWHSYEEQRNVHGRDKEDAMAHAIAGTITSVTGSSITTVAGFLALCFMTFTLGKDLGIVMAKGVVFGVIGCITILPSLILTFDKVITKTSHKALMPKFTKLSKVVTSKPKIIALFFVILLIPSFIGYQKADVYYNLDRSVPDYLPFRVANNKLADEFQMNSTHMLLVDSHMQKKDVSNMMKEIDKVDGVKFTLGLESIMGPAVPDEIIPGSMQEIVKGDRYQLLIINSEYSVATGKVNRQINEINKIVKGYDDKGLLIGEAPCTRDLISITDRDFKVVSGISIAAIFLIIALVLKSITLPVILVAVIELAIFINLGIPYYTGTVLPFIASICISTIQLGATVDYAILMTTRYKRERSSGKDKLEAIRTAYSVSMPSVTVSALGFFAATFGVGLYSDIDIISSLCSLMARGAIISLLVVMFILPAMFTLFDKIICRTSKGFSKIDDNILQGE
ncbi:MAG: MMPL family transporter [Bacillota bacterium]|nr:MMPL family transporter [Bacillota bacterium]